MARINDKIAAFLTEDKNHKVTQKKIHRSNYSAYEKELLEFCIWVNDIENYKDVKRTLMELPISFFCNNNELFLNYIHKKDNQDKDCLMEIKAISDCLFIYTAILYKYQLFQRFDQSIIQTYSEDELNHLFGLYQYYLYQEDSPLVEMAKQEYHKKIEELPQNDTLKEIYDVICQGIDSGMKKNFAKLTKKRNQVRKDMAEKTLYELHRETKTKVLIHKKRSEGLRRKN